MLIQFTGYAVDCTIEAQYDLTTDRLRDQLNVEDQVVLLRATMTRLVDGSQLCVQRLVLDQEELYAVEGGQSRGGDGRRLHTVLHRKRLRLGPYSVLGHLHERPGVAPLGGLRLSRPFVAFTDARIAYQSGSTLVDHEVGTLIINGRQIAWLGDASSQPDDESPETASLMTLADAI